MAAVTSSENAPLFFRVSPRDLHWENKIYKLKRVIGLLTPITEDNFFSFLNVLPISSSFAAWGSLRGQCIVRYVFR